MPTALNFFLSLVGVLSLLPPIVFKFSAIFYKFFSKSYRDKSSIEFREPFLPGRDTLGFDETFSMDLILKCLLGLFFSVLVLLFE